MQMIGLLRHGPLAKYSLFDMIYSTREYSTADQNWSASLLNTLMGDEFLLHNYPA
jgi:hypothetical protein